MNGKTAKLLRKIGRNDKKGKKMWKLMNHLQRGATRSVIKQGLAGELKEPQV